MGRLIDADKLKAQIEAHEIIKKFSITEYECGHNVGLCIGIDEVDESETIDAIPIDWIVTFKDSIKAGALMEPREVIKFMLEAWKEEQKEK